MPHFAVLLSCFLVLALSSTSVSAQTSAEQPVLFQDHDEGKDLEAGAPLYIAVEEPRPDVTVEVSPTYVTIQSLTTNASSANASVANHDEAEDLSQPRPPGTHFILEMHLGANVTGDFGFAGAGLFGVGGKPPGLPFRFYLTAELGHTVVQDGRDSDGSAISERAYTTAMLGLRTYIPIFGPLRLFLDLSGGAVLSDVALRHGEQHVFGEDWHGAFSFGGGLQARVLHQLSVGLRTRVLFAGDPLSELREASGLSSSLPLQLTGSATWHF